MAVEHQISELICGITSCKQKAEHLGFAFLSDLLAAALLEAALQSVGGDDVLSNPELRLERLLELKFKTAVSTAGENIVEMHPV